MGLFSTLLLCSLILGPLTNFCNYQLVLLVGDATKIPGTMANSADPNQTAPLGAV